MVKVQGSGPGQPVSVATGVRPGSDGPDPVGRLRRRPPNVGGRGATVVGHRVGWGSGEVVRGGVGGVCGGAARPFTRARYRHDRRFRDSVDYAASHGIPLSTFLQDWLPEDRETVHIWMDEQRLRCTRCGTADYEWEEGPGWEADLWRCKGCEQIDRQHERLRDSPGSTDGMQVRMFPVVEGVD